MAVATAQREGPGRLAQWREGIRRLVRRSWSFFGGLALSALAIFALVALITYHPSDPSLNTDAAGPVRNWTLDGGGFDGLLSRIEQLLSKSGLPKTIVDGRARHPLGVRDRLTLQRAIARAEFLVRHRQ